MSGFSHKNKEGKIRNFYSELGLDDRAEELIALHREGLGDHTKLDDVLKEFATIIKGAYRKKAREVHPDHGGDEESFERVNEANNVLKDPRYRKAYNSIIYHFGGIEAVRAALDGSVVRSTTDVEQKPTKSFKTHKPYRTPERVPRVKPAVQPRLIPRANEPVTTVPKKKEKNLIPIIPFRNIVIFSAALAAVGISVGGIWCFSSGESDDSDHIVISPEPIPTVEPSLPLPKPKPEPSPVENPEPIVKPVPLPKPEPIAVQPKPKPQYGDGEVMVPVCDNMNGCADEDTENDKPTYTRTNWKNVGDFQKECPTFTANDWERLDAVAAITVRCKGKNFYQGKTCKDSKRGFERPALKDSGRFSFDYKQLERLTMNVNRVCENRPGTLQQILIKKLD